MEAERSSVSGAVLVEAPQPHSESSSRSSKTSSSDDVFRKLIISLDGAVPGGGRPLRRGSKAATVSAVTEDARRVLEHFLKTKYGEAKQGEISDESPYALLVQPPMVGQPVPVVAHSSKLCPCLPGSRPHQTYAQDEDEGKNEFTDYEKIDDSPDYAECGDADSPSDKSHTFSSQKGFDTIHRLPFGHGEHSDQLHHEAQLHALKVKSKAKAKAKRKALFDSASSSSTEDYEYPDVELLGRKKKSFFKWASERLRQSFVRQSKKPASGNGDEQESPKAESLPALPTPRSLKKKKDKVTRLQMVAMKRSSSDKSKSTSASPPNQEEVHSDGQLALERTGGPLPEDTMRSLKSERRPSVADPTDVMETSAKRPWKSPMTKKKHENGGKKASDDKDNRGLFDSLLKQIRKGSQKLKRKGSKQHQRSKSADNLHIRPLSKEHAKVLRRYIEDTEGKDGDSDIERHTVHSIHEVSIHRLDGAATLPPSLPRPQLPPPSPLLAGGEGTVALPHSPRRPTHLEGLVPCADTKPRPKVQDATDGPPRPPLLPEPVYTKPFHLRSAREKEELYERIAEQLAAIADHYNLESPKSPKSSSSPTSHSGPSESETEKLGATAPRRGHRVRSAELERQLGALLREKGDIANRDIPDPTPVVAELVKNASYSKFKQIVNENIGTDPGWQQLAMMFRFTQTAVQLAGMGTAVALQIKEMTLTYFEDKFAGWIVGQGGWESMVEDTNTEQDSELD